MSALAVEDPLAFLDPWVKTQVPHRLKSEDPWTLVQCFSCGFLFNVRSRQARSLRAGDRKPFCSFCRGGPGVPRVFRVGPEHRAYWLRRFSLAEICEMAEASWGPVDEWPADWREGFVFT